MKVNADALATAGFEYLGTSYKTMDCQKFVERCLRDCGLKIDLPGSNAWYRKMTWSGTPEACAAKFGSVPPGAFLFILESDGKEPSIYRKDGIGNASHMGIVIGQSQGAIHSSESRSCVCESFFNGRTIKNGGWNRVGLWNQVDYGDRVNAILSGDSKERSEELLSVIREVWAQEGATVNLRSAKKISSPYVVRVPIGEKVEVSEDDGSWSTVRWNRFSGYMMSIYLRDVQDASSVAVTASGNPDSSSSDESASGNQNTSSEGNTATGYPNLSSADASASGNQNPSSADISASGNPNSSAHDASIHIPHLISDGVVTLTLPKARAEALLPLLDALCDQLTDQIGRG